MKPANSQKGSNARETPVTGCSLNPRASPKPHRLPPSLFPLPQASLSSASSPNPPAGARLRLQPTRCCPGQEQGFDTWSVARLPCSGLLPRGLVGQGAGMELAGGAPAGDGRAVTCARSRALEQSTRPSCSPSRDVPRPPPLLWGSKSFSME